VKVSLPNLATIGHVALPAVSLSLLLAVAVPTTVYFSNSEELTWQGSLWMSVGLVSFAVSLTLLSIARFISNRIFSPLSATFLVLSSYVIVRGYFLPVSFGTLEGKGQADLPMLSDWSLYTSFGILVSCGLFHHFNEKLVRFFVLAGTIVSLGLIVFVYGMSALNEASGGAQSGAAPVSYGAFSSDLNIIVLSLDSVQNDVFDRLLASKVALKEIFDGFTWYADVTSFAPNTRFSLLSTLTGRYVPSGTQGDDFEDLFDDLSGGSIATMLANQDFQVDTFGVHCRVVPGANCQGLNTIIPGRVAAQGVVSAYEVSALRLLPVSVSQTLIAAHQRRVLDEFDMPVAASDVERLIEIGRRDKKALGYKLQMLALRALYENPTVTSKPVFKFYHYVITHFPARFDEECGYDIRRTNDFTSAEPEIECALRELDKLFSALKRMRIYDRSLIVVMSDHGYESGVQPTELGGQAYLGGTINEGGIWSASRYWPILLVKPIDTRGELQVNDGRASLVDVTPTLCGSIDPSLCQATVFDGQSLFDSLPESRVRQAMFYVGGVENRSDKHIDTRLFERRSLIGRYDDAVPRAMRAPPVLSKQPAP
jgi:hypothetical protein